MRFELAKPVRYGLLAVSVLLAPALMGLERFEAQRRTRTVTRTTTRYIYRPGHGYGRWVNRRWVPRSRVRGRDFDRDGVRDNRDRDIDGDGVRNNRDRNDYNRRRR
jgi:hypothetical protein